MEPYQIAGTPHPFASNTSSVMSTQDLGKATCKSERAARLSSVNVTYLRWANDRKCHIDYCDIIIDNQFIGIMFLFWLPCRMQRPLFVACRSSDLRANYMSWGLYESLSVESCDKFSIDDLHEAPKFCLKKKSLNSLTHGHSAGRRSWQMIPFSCVIVWMNEISFDVPFAQKKSNITQFDATYGDVFWELTLG